MDYNDIFQALYRSDVRYLLCGGLAVNIYGIPRMTADIDFLLEMEADNVLRFQTVMASFGYSPSLPLDLKELVSVDKRKYYLTERNLIAYSFVSLQMASMSVDVLLDSPFTFEDMWKRKELRKMQEAEIYIVSVQDLIDMKKYANRAQDQSDILLLSKLLES